MENKSSSGLVIQMRDNHKDISINVYGDTTEKNATNTHRGMLNELDDYTLIPRKAEISDAMSIIITMHQYHADREEEKASLIEALNVLADYNKLVTELEKKK